VADETVNLKKPDKIVNFIDEWPENSARFNHQNSRPSDYVILEVVAISAEATDLPFGEANFMYVSLRDEVAARADHKAPQYRIDDAFLSCCMKPWESTITLRCGSSHLYSHMIDMVLGLLSRRTTTEVVSWRPLRLQRSIISIHLVIEVISRIIILKRMSQCTISSDLS
jgi:hypothetical protein